MPVVVASVVRKPMPVLINAIGTVQPIATVVVKSRIDGQIVKVNVQDGQEVKAGDVLIQLDSRAAEAQVRQADAQLARDRAAARQCKARGGPSGYAGRQALHARRNRRPRADHRLGRRSRGAGRRGRPRNLKAQLSYYTIISSIDGRVGAIALKEGNAVKAVERSPS